MKIGLNTHVTSIQVLQNTRQPAIGVSSQNKTGAAGRYDTFTSTKKNQSPLQKMMAQLQEQYKNIKDSDMSQDSKDTTLKALEEQMAQLQEQIAKENLNKTTEKTEDKNKKEDVVTENLQEKGVHVVGKDLILGISSSSSSIKSAEVCMSQYSVASHKNGGKGDLAVMNRALGYAMPEMSKATEGTKIIQKATANTKPAKAKEPVSETEQSTAEKEQSAVRTDENKITRQDVKENASGDEKSKDKTENQPSEPVGMQS